MIKKLEHQLQSLIADRGTFEAHWDEIIDYLLPGYGSVTSESSPGEKKTAKIYDASPIHALRNFASGLMGVFSNPAIPWFRLRFERPELNQVPAARIWLEEVENRIYHAFQVSNFYDITHQAYMTFGALGTFIVFVEAHPVRLLHFRNHHIREIFIAHNYYDQVDTVYRIFTMTAKQIIEQWGNKAPDEVQRDYKGAGNKPYRRHELVHVVLPREPGKRKTDRMTPENKPWASVYYHRASKTLLSEGGYDEMPYLVCRDQRMYNELYGRSLGMIALPDIKTLNRIEYDMLTAGAMAVHPPVFVSNTAMIKPIRIQPAAINILSTPSINDRIQPFDFKGNLAYGEEKAEQKRSKIREIFFNDLLQLVAGPEMTATEVVQRTHERLRLMGPILGSLQSEYFTPLFDRVFNLMLRAEMLPPWIDEIQGESLRVDYISPLAMAQKDVQLDQLSKSMSLIGMIAGIFPQVSQVINADELARLVMYLSGLPTKTVYSPEEVAAMRQQAQQLAQQQMEIADAERLAQAGKHVGQGIGALGRGMGSFSDMLAGPANSGPMTGAEEMEELM